MPAADHPLSKTEHAYRTLRSEILLAHLRPGQALKLSVLGSTYDLSWTPLREALSRLEADRLVVAQHNRGYIVTPLRQEDLEDLQRTRLAVELPALLESMQRGGEAWESAVRVACPHWKPATPQPWRPGKSGTTSSTPPCCRPAVRAGCCTFSSRLVTSCGATTASWAPCRLATKAAGRARRCPPRSPCTTTPS